MKRAEFEAARKFVETSFGRVAYVEKGTGPVALFVHAFGLNGFQWRDVLDLLAPQARCIAIDLLGHGHTVATPALDPTLSVQAKALAEVVTSLGLGALHLVGNDTGGGVAQFLATDSPARIRSLCLIDSEAHDNVPPAGLSPLISLAERGELEALYRKLAGDVKFARAAMGAPLYHDPEQTLSTEVAGAYLEPLLRDPASFAAFSRVLLAMERAGLVSLEPKLRGLTVPSLVLWGEEDRVFSPSWGEWLARTLPNATLTTIPKAGLCWPEEQPALLARLLVDFWAAA